MSESLNFRLYVESPGVEEGSLTSLVFNAARTLGLRDTRKGKAVRATAPETTAPSGSPSLDGELAGKSSEEHDTTQSLFGFDLQSGEPWSLFISFGRTAADSSGGWWTVEVETKLSKLYREDEMNAFLDRIILPLCKTVRPRFALGDVWEYNAYELTAGDLKLGKPSNVCWFNYYGPQLGKRLNPSAIERLSGYPTHRLEQFADGSLYFVVDSLPRPEPRGLVREIIGLRHQPDSE